MCLFDIAVAIPWLHVSMPRLHESNSAFNHPSGEQTVFGKAAVGVALLAAHAAVAVEAAERQPLAAGHLDLVLEDGLATHDIMGVVQLIRAAGGIVTDKTGGAVSMAGTDSLLAAATAELHAAALEMMG